MMKLLFIAPLPPPVTGQSLAAGVFLEELQRHYSVKVINFNKGTFRQGLNSFRRVVEVIKIFKDIWLAKRETDVLYLAISQSKAGNIKDLFTYLICFRKLNKMIIHLHGGGIRDLLFDKSRFFYCINKFFLSRLSGAVVLGESLVPVFNGLVPRGRIHVVVNFAEDYLFLNKDRIEEKFKRTSPLKILFLSNLIPGKGHEELVDAYKALKTDLKRMVQIDFAGGFESEDQKRSFLRKIEGYEGIYYHGIADYDLKKILFSNAHLFCLPSYYAYEGQPVSILEAYASGCVVITTDHGGIRDIFSHGENGFFVEKQSSRSLKDKMEELILCREQLVEIGLRNNDIAKLSYRKSSHVLSMLEVINKVKSD